MNTNENELGIPEGEEAAVSKQSLSIWNRPLACVLLSSCISGAFLSFGWKASMDTVNAVNTVKLNEHDEAIKSLQQQEHDRIKASDLAMRDQLLDAKLSLLQAEIAGVKEQLASMRQEKR